MMHTRDEPHNNHSDEALVALALENVDNYALIIERYRVRLLAYIRRISSFPPYACEEILQEGLLKVWKNLNDFDQKRKFINWIYRIIYTTTLSYWRKEKRHLMNVPQSDFDIENFSLPKTLESEIIHKIDVANVQRALRSLPLQYREIIVLRYWEDRSYDELSSILKKPKGTVATLVKRAKERLRKKMEEYEA